MPRISIIIPAFNSVRFLDRTLRSVFAQDYNDYELIVADDGSTDGTAEVIRRYRRIVYLYQSNRGVASARNLGLSRASGEYVAYLDADDIWYPHKLRTQLDFFEAHPECGLVHSDYGWIDEQDRVIHRDLNRETGRTPPRGHCVIDLIYTCHVGTLTVLARRDLIERVGRFDERLRSVEDYLQWILLAMDGVSFGYVDQTLAMYRRTAGSLSHQERDIRENLVLLFRLLLEEKALAARFGESAAAVARGRLYTLQRELVYLDRLEGRLQHARSRLVSLIREWPGHGELYLDLVKCCVPASLGQAIHGMKANGIWRRVGKFGSDAYQGAHEAGKEP